MLGIRKAYGPWAYRLMYVRMLAHAWWAGHVVLTLEFIRLCMVAHMLGMLIYSLS
jgi:hypothetical protein